jgi:5-methyltetrahydrofolate--homocysteine methyltransferase
MAEHLNDISKFLQSGRIKKLIEALETALKDGMKANDILQNGLMAGMDIVATKFKNNEVYVPEVLLAAKAMNEGTALLKPYLADEGAEKGGKALIGTVKGDLHDIGKNLVRMMFEGKGFEVVDLGVDVSPEEFLEAQKKEQADIIALSALLTTTMVEMKTTIDAFVNAGIRHEVVFMVGGAPISDSFRESVGADIYTEDAASAAEAAKEVVVRKYKTA